MRLSLSLTTLVVFVYILLLVVENVDCKRTNKCNKGRERKKRDINERQTARRLRKKDLEATDDNADQQTEVDEVISEVINEEAKQAENISPEENNIIVADTNIEESVDQIVETQDEANIAGNEEPTAVASEEEDVLVEEEEKNEEDEEEEEEDEEEELFEEFFGQSDDDAQNTENAPDTDEQSAEDTFWKYVMNMFGFSSDDQVVLEQWEDQKGQMETDADGYLTGDMGFLDPEGRGYFDPHVEQNEDHNSAISIEVVEIGKQTQESQKLKRRRKRDAIRAAKLARKNKRNTRI